VKSLDELAAYSKAHPKTLSFTVRRRKRPAVGMNQRLR
jgi:hypothetical protein